MGDKSIKMLKYVSNIELIEIYKESIEYRGFAESYCLNMYVLQIDNALLLESVQRPRRGIM